MKRELPPSPAFARAVDVPEPKEGEPLLLIAARERAGRLKANRTIVSFSRWYSCVRETYAEGACP